ncbi:MAG: hypothetical protein JSU76_01520 [Dehalococcoidia bacterium]|nr:MAG: hypothetical protein JSU76_01520 [Dehalococcoidia bacterium]
MKTAPLIVAVLSTVAMLCVLAYPNQARANPELILEPGFETVNNWVFDWTDADFSGAQSESWGNKTGTYSYLISGAGVNITGGKYGEVYQGDGLNTVDFTSIDTVSFDTSLSASVANFTADMLVSDTSVWSQAVPTSATEYMHQEVDVSGYTGIQYIRFRITCNTTSNNCNLACYFDNIKIWGSYSNTGRTTVSNNFSTYGVSVYMYGENFDTSGTYKVGYYDGGTAHDGANGALLQTDTYTNDPDGILDTSLIRPADFPSSSYGTWHAVVYKTTGSMPDPYSSVSKGDTAYTVTDSFTVTVDCIPEFPTRFAAVGVGGLCFGIYRWMRRRRSACQGPESL